MKDLKVRITFTEEVLGTANSNPEIHAEFIASKGPNAKTREEEIEAIGEEAVEKKEMTIFPRNSEGQPIFFDYQWKGLFKDACGMLRNAKGTKSEKFTAYKKKIDGLIFPFPRMIPIELAGPMGTCQRPLRAQTAQGERISLANSETVPAGSTCEFTIHILEDSYEPLVREWLDYGILKGMGCWRNSGKGRFTWEEVE